MRVNGDFWNILLLGFTKTPNIFSFIVSKKGDLNFVTNFKMF